MRLLAALLLVFAALPARAAGLNAGLNQSFGPDKYEGTDAYLALGLGGLSIAPEYRRYSAEAVNGTTHSLSARVGYDMRWFGIGVTGGITPRSRPEGYSNAYGGADVSLTLSPGGEDGIRRIGGPGRGGAPVGKGIARVDFGGGILSTAHEQAGAGTAPRTKLTQNEIHGFVGASVLDFLLVSGRLAKFTYNRDLQGGANLPIPRWTPITGHIPLVNDYPETSFHLNFEFPVFPMIRPFADYTFTDFAELPGGATPADARAFGVGLRVGLELVAAEARFQHIDSAGPDSDNFVSVGASLRL